MEAQTENAKIMVNWKKRKIFPINFHKGSRQYRDLIDKGYEEVGTAKSVNPLFIQPEYFDYKDRYPDLDITTG